MEPKRDAQIKYTTTNLDNACDGVVIMLDLTKERIPEFEDISIQTSKTEK
jgi:hypothetical protein